MPKPLEKVVEDRFANFIDKRTTSYCIKLYKRHWPDRLVILRGGRCFFIEFKREHNGKLSPGQREMLRRLRQRGQHVYVCNTYESAMEAYINEI